MANCTIQQNILITLKDNNLIDDKFNIIGNTSQVFPYIASINAKARKDFGVKEDLIETLTVKNTKGVFVKVKFNESVANYINENKDKSNLTNSRYENSTNRTKLQEIVEGDRETKKTEFQQLYNFLTEESTKSKGETSPSYKDSTTSKRQQEKSLIKFAKRNKYMLPSDYFEDYNYLAQGGESIVYEDLDEDNSVIKLNSSSQYGNWKELLSSISIFNHLFPETQYSFRGFIINEDNQLCIALQQPKIEDEQAVSDGYYNLLKDEELSLSDINDDLGDKAEPLKQKLKDLGFEVPEEVNPIDMLLSNLLGEDKTKAKIQNLNLGEYKHRELGFIISDLHTGNVMFNNNQVYIIDALIEEDRNTNQQPSIFNSRHDSDQENSEEVLPLGDNYVEFLNYKKDQLASVEKQLEFLFNKLKNEDTSDNREKQKTLNNLKRELDNQIKLLSENRVDYMFHTILEDLDNIEKALKDSSLSDIESIKKKLDFYNTFIVGTNPDYKGESLSMYEGSDFDKISGQMNRIMENYQSNLENKIIEYLETDEGIQNILKNNPEISTKDLLNVSKDLNVVDTYLLGILSSNSKDTILPQFLFTLMQKVKYRNSLKVESLIDKINELEKTSGIVNPDWIYSKDENGDKDGYIIDTYSGQWFKALSRRNTLIKKYKEDRNNKDTTAKTSYNEVINWLNDNAFVVDFTRLSAVKDIYGGHPEYSKYFKYTKEQIEAYENNLSQKLGPKYEDEVKKIINKLQKFEELKQDAPRTEWYERNIAENNIWEFLNNYKTNKYMPIEYTYEHGNKSSKVYFNAFYDLSIIPKDKVTRLVTTDAGPQYQEVNTKFYDENFQDEVMSNPKNLEYYKLIKEASEYINNTYELSLTGRLTYPKIQASFAESVIANYKNKDINNMKVGTDALRRLGHEWKAMYYEKGGHKFKDTKVTSNYSDVSKQEINEKAKLYQLQGLSRENAYNKARKEVLETYSTDLGRDIKAVLMEAALHNTRLEVAPIADAFLTKYKDIDYVDPKGNVKERVNGIKRFEFYIDHVIYNNTQKYRESNNIEGQSWNPGIQKYLDAMESHKIASKFAGEKSLNLLSDTEKEVYRGLKELQLNGPTSPFVIEDNGLKLEKRIEEGKIKYFKDEIELQEEEFNKEFNDYITDKISKLGLDLNLAGAIDGILKTVIYKNLALNPVSGIFNRIEGKHSAYIMDATGLYWTPGNFDIASDMLSYTTLRKLTFDKVGLGGEKRIKQIEIFEAFAKKLGVLQDRKNELQRNVSDSKFSMETFNLMKFSVDYPELKNQGGIMMAIMMDKTIKDKEGNDHPLLNKDTKEFTCFNVENGVLSFKPEFDNNTFEEFENLVIDITTAVSRSQGNYNPLDIMYAKKSIWGRAASMFLTWMPEHLHQRFGTNNDNIIDYMTGKKKPEGRFITAFKANKVNTLTGALAAIGISYGALGVVGLVGAAGLSAYVYNKYMKGYVNKDSVNRDVNHIQEFTQMLFSLGIEMINYPASMAQAIPGVGKLKIKNNTFKNTTMTEQERQAMVTLTRELAIMLTMLSIKLAIMAMYKGIGGEDDDKDDPRRMKYNFIQNQLSRSITSLNGFLNPYAFVKDNSRNAFLSELSDIYNLTLGVATFDFDRVKDHALDPVPIPRILHKGKMPYHDKIDYASQVDFEKIPAPLHWTTELFKDVMSDGEYSDKKKYNKLRKEKREQIKEDLLSEYGDNKDALKTILDAKMKDQVGSKYKELSYEEAADMVNNEEVIKEPKKKATRSDRNAFKDKLKEQGLSNEEISKAMAEEFRGR